MDPEISIEKQHFALVKEKIIKISEVLQVCNAKDEKYAKVSLAFKQLKAKYETCMHEKTRLEMDNEHLSYSLATIRPKYEQNERDLTEMKSDYCKVNDRYEKNMIESQITITELQEKIKHCTCQNELVLSPSKKRNLKEQKEQKLKETCKGLKEVENKLKSENNTLLLKNKEIQEQHLRSLKIIKDISSKNALLQKELSTLKDKIQKMEVISEEQKNLHLHITSLKTSHEKEIHSLKMELSKLSIENQKIKYLELECTRLKEQINISEKKDCSAQTEKCSENISSISFDNERITALELECQKLQKKLKEFETSSVTKKDFSIQTDVMELGQIPKFCEENTSDLEDSLQDIWKEMILPMALSPLSFSSTESPAHFIEPIPSLEELDQKTSSNKFIPNIIITPPTPYVDQINVSGSMFPLVTASLEEKLQEKEVVVSESVNVGSNSIKQDIAIPLDNITKIESSEIVRRYSEQSMDIEHGDIVFGMNGDKQWHSLTKKQKVISLHDYTKSAITKPESAIQCERVEKSPLLEILETPKLSKESMEISLENQQLPPKIISCSTLHTSPIITCEKSVNTESETLNTSETTKSTQVGSLDEGESAIQCERDENSSLLEIQESPKLSKERIDISLGNQQLQPKIISCSTLHTSPILTCEKSVNTESEMLNNGCHTSETTKSAQVRSLDKAKHLKGKVQNRRKFLMPYSMNPFVKCRQRHKGIKKYKHKSSNQNDTILSALRTLQQNKINFTISNESIPIIQPYSCYSVISTPKVEPRIISERNKDTFCYTANCWSKKCISNNTQMLLRKVQNQEEPELLGFFSVKDEVITPSASRMAVPQKPRPADPQEVIEQLLNGIKKLVDIKSKDTNHSRKKKRTKSRSRRSEFYSETETELENLFRKSADVLERNRKFLAAAKNQNWSSSDESVLESEADLMVDSGLVSGTPKIDTDSLGFFSQSETSNVIKPDTKSPIIKADKVESNNILQSFNKESTILQKSDIGFSSPSSKTTVTCSTPSYSICPEMLSPIASSKGSPEAIQVASTPLQTAKSNVNLMSSLDFFKAPFCPIMVSPLASSKQGQEVLSNFQSVSRVDMSSVNRNPNYIEKFPKTSTEIQNIVSMFPKESIGDTTTISMNSNNNRQVERVLASNQKGSETDLFGDISDSDDNSCAEANKDVVAEITTCNKVVKEHTVSEEMMSQAKGIVNRKNGGCNSMTRNQNDSNAKVTESIVTRNDFAGVENKAKKINIVENILISKGHTVNLLSKDIKSDLRVPGIMKSPSPTNQREKTVKTSRKSPLQLSDVSDQENNQSNITHIDSFILDQKVMQHIATPSCDKEEMALEEKNEQNGIKGEEYFDCPKSPDLIEVPDHLPQLLSTEKPVKLPPKNMEIAEENNSWNLGYIPISSFKDSLLDHDYTKHSKPLEDMKKDNETLSLTNISDNKEDTVEDIRKSDASGLDVDLSIKSSDLNYTLEDIHISALDLSSMVHNEQNEIPEVNHSPNKELSNLECDDLNNSKCQVISPNTEKRYSLRDRSSSERRTNRAYSPEMISPRARASKRKLFKKQPYDPSDTIALNSCENSAEPIKRKRGRPAKNGNSIKASDIRDLKNTEVVTLLPEATLETMERKYINMKGHYNVEVNVSSHIDVPNINRDKIEDHIEMEEIKTEDRKICHQQRKTCYGYPDNTILKHESDSEEKTDRVEIKDILSYQKFSNDRKNIVNDRQNIVKSKDYISKEFISESETESEVSYRMDGVEMDDSNSSDVQSKNCDVTNNAKEMEELQIDARSVTHSEKSRYTNPDGKLLEAEPRTERNFLEKVADISREESELDIEVNNPNKCANNEPEQGVVANIQSISGALLHFSKTNSAFNENPQKTTSEIQNILRMLHEDPVRERPTISLKTGNNYREAESVLSSNRKVSETDIFGHMSDSDEDPCARTNKNVEVAQKAKPAKVIRKKGTVSSSNRNVSETDIFGDMSDSDEYPCARTNKDVEVAQKAKPDKVIRKKETVLSSNQNVSETDIFGDMSNSDEDPCARTNKVVEVARKAKPAKVVKKKGNTLRKKIMSQVKGMVYAFGADRGHNSSTRNQNNLFLEAPKSIFTENILPGVENCAKETNIVGNNLISTKGKTMNLQSKDDKCKQTHDAGKTMNLQSNDDKCKHTHDAGKIMNLQSNDDKCKQTHDAASDLRDTDIVRSPSPTIERERPTKTYSRKRLRLEQKISNSASTPVDILSQVIQGMVKTGPKAQARKNPPQVLNVLDQEKKRNYHTHIDGFKATKNVMQHTVTQSCDKEGMVLAEDTEQNGNEAEEFFDCPKSPDVIEVPDRLPKLIPTEKPVKLPPSKVRILIDKLMVFSNESKMLDGVISEFVFQDVAYIVEIILDKLSMDYHDKADNMFPPSPPMTSTQRILLGFLLRLDKSTHPGIREKFLSQAEMRLFSKYTCTLETVQPITRLITALYKLKYDLNRIRRFICEGFYFMGDFAVPMFFTLLTMWPEALPMDSETSDKMLAKVIVQSCYLKECNQPGYNLLPLRDLLHKYYGYPLERWNCENFFRDILVEYIRNPSIRSSDFALLLFLKNKPTKWGHQKIKDHILPLFQKAPDSNPNLKATLLILLANICCGFQKNEDYDWSVILEMDRWFLELDIDELHPIIKRSICLARGRLPRRINVRKRNKNNEQNVTNNKSNSPDSCEKAQSELEKIADFNDHSKGDITNSTNDEKKQDLNEDSDIIKFEVITYDSDNESMEDFSENSNTVNIELPGWSLGDRNCESTNQIVNIDVKLDSDQTISVCQDSVFSISNDKESDSMNSSLSDIEF